MTPPMKPTGKETLEVRPNTIPRFATGTDGLINFYGTGYHPNADYEIRYLDFVWTKRADDKGNWYFGISASSISEDEIGTIKATVNHRGDHKPLASANFTVVE